MLTYPSLSVNPDVQGWEESRAFDPTIRARSEAGYVKTRPRTTRVPMQWKVLYQNLPAADKAAVQNFESLVMVGADAFAWTNPMDGVVKTVRFKELVRCSPMGSRLYWRVEFTLEEV